MKKKNLSAGALLAACLIPTSLLAAGGNSRLSDEPIPFATEDELPDLTPPLFELGDVFLRPGNIKPGFEIPTGAVWQPRLWVFGSLRSSLHTFQTESTPCPLGGGGTAEERCTEWANRLDLFGNLQLTGTERLLVGLQPLHQRGRFTGITLEPDDASTDDDFRDETNFDVTTLFFEGDIGEIFPGLDPTDKYRYDWGFSIGRQPLAFQDGLLVNDTMDSLGLTRNNLRIDGWDWLNNLRLTFLYAWNRVGNEANPATDEDAQMLALFTAWDTVFGNRFASTFELDAAYVTADDPNGDVLTAGFGAIQRFGHVGTSFRLLGSMGLDDDAIIDADGVLAFVETSLTPYGTHNVLYMNGFLAIDNFTSAARGPDAGGPLGRVGLLFAARGIGRYPSPLSNAAGRAFGSAVGYQMFFDNNRRQLVAEVGGRLQEDPVTEARSGAIGLGLRLQQAVGKRLIVDLDGFIASTRRDQQSISASGARIELLWKL